MQANAGYPDGMRSVRTFNKTCTDLQLVKINMMGWRRWCETGWGHHMQDCGNAGLSARRVRSLHVLRYPSATLLPSGKVLIMGGTQVRLELDRVTPRVAGGEDGP